MKITKIKNRSVLFTYNNSEWDLNLHLIMGKRYNYIIDTGLGSLSMEPVKEYIKNDNKPIIGINTHYHWDHIWGNGSLQAYMIVSHKLCRELIESEWDRMMQRNGRYVVGEAEKRLPDLTFEKELYFPEDKIRIFYTPGHTIDSISVIDEEEKVINLGDNVGDTLDEIVPNIAAGEKTYRETLLGYNNMEFDTCLSGHNGILGKDVIEKILNLLSPAQ